MAACLESAGAAFASQFACVGPFSCAIARLLRDQMRVAQRRAGNTLARHVPLQNGWVGGFTVKMAAWSIRKRIGSIFLYGQSRVNQAVYFRGAVSGAMWAVVSAANDPTPAPRQCGACLPPSTNAAATDASQPAHPRLRAGDCEQESALSLTSHQSPASSLAAARRQHFVRNHVLHGNARRPGPITSAAAGHSRATWLPLRAGSAALRRSPWPAGAAPLRHRG